MPPAPVWLQQLARAGLQSGTIMATADLVTQTAMEEQVNGRRTARWAVAGLVLHGPYFFLGFRRIDQYFGAATTLQIVAYKCDGAVHFISSLSGGFIFVFGVSGTLRRPAQQQQQQQQQQQRQQQHQYWEGCLGQNLPVRARRLYGWLCVLARGERDQFWSCASLDARSVYSDLGRCVELVLELDECSDQQIAIASPDKRPK